MFGFVRESLTIGVDMVLAMVGVSKFRFPNVGRLCVLIGVHSIYKFLRAKSYAMHKCL